VGDHRRVVHVRTCAVPAVCGEGVVKRAATAQRLVQPGSDGERPQRPLPVTLLVGPSTSGKTMCGLVDGPTMDTRARSVGEPQQSELVSQRVWSRVATFTEAPGVRLKCLRESARSERPPEGPHVSDRHDGPQHPRKREISCPQEGK